MLITKIKREYTKNDNVLTFNISIYGFFFFFFALEKRIERRIQHNTKTNKKAGFWKMGRLIWKGKKLSFPILWGNYFHGHCLRIWTKTLKKTNRSKGRKEMKLHKSIETESTEAKKKRINEGTSYLRTLRRIVHKQK